MMESLHAAATSSTTKKLVSFPRGTHNDTCLASGYFEAVIEFWHRHIFPPASSL